MIFIEWIHAILCVEAKKRAAVFLPIHCEIKYFGKSSYTSEFTIEFHCFVEFNPDQFTQVNSKFIADFN